MLERYFADLRELTDAALLSERAPHDYFEALLESGDELAYRLVDAREQMLSGTDRERATGYLTLGFFTEFELQKRIAAFLVVFELEDLVRQLEIRSRLAQYSRTQALFEAEPELLNAARKEELIAISELPEVEPDGAVRLRHGYGRLDPFLPPSLVRWISSTFPDAPHFVRLDPLRATTERPRSQLVETVLVPADPRWWERLGLHPRNTTSAVYRLYPPESPTQDLEAYWEYHIKGLRRLETRAERKKAEHLTILMEELQVRGDLLIGRGIHFDTAAPFGTSPEGALVMHIDLAINVYAERDVAKRLNERLSEGKVSDATFRSHLLRSEAVPMSVAVALCMMFFQSRVLLRDLVANQFARSLGMHSPPDV